MMFLYLVFFAVLIIGYKYGVVPLFEYQGWVFSLNRFKLLISLIILLIISYIAPVDIKKPSTAYIQLMLLLIIVPMLVLFSVANKPWFYMVQSLTSCVIIIVLSNYVRIKPFYIPRLSYNFVITLFVGISVFYILIIVMRGGFQYFNIDISKVYDFRSGAAENLPSVFRYISPMVGKVFLPVALILAYSSKKFKLSAFIVFLSILVFGFTSNKGPLIYPFIVLVVYLLLSRQNYLADICKLSILVLVISVFDFLLRLSTDNVLLGWFGSLTMRRIFLVPADLNYLYYDFFSKNEFILWSDSKITFGFLDYIYDLSPSHLIGLEYFNNEATGANTGWLGSGYMHAGYIGVFIYSVIISFIFVYIDGVARCLKNYKLVAAANIIPIVTLMTSSDLPSVFLTHGLFINLIIISLLIKDRVGNA